MTATDHDEMVEPDAPRRRRPWLVPVLLGVLLAAGIVLVHRPSPSGLTRTRHALEADSRWVNGPTAGATLVTASRWLLDDGKACQHRRGPADPRCGLRLSASAYAGVSAFVVDRCTAPGVYRARTSLLGFVRAITAFENKRLGTTAVPRLPDVPTC